MEQYGGYCPIVFTHYVKTFFERFFVVFVGKSVGEEVDDRGVSGVGVFT